MKFLKSIKWRLQIWYGLILLGVLVALGVTAWQLQRDSLMGRIDNELDRRFSTLANALHGHPPGPVHFPFDRPPPGQRPDDAPPRENPPHPDVTLPPRDEALFLPPGENPPPARFHLPPRDEALFDPSDPHNFYFIIYDVRNHTELARSTNVPVMPTKTGFIATSANQIPAVVYGNTAPQFPPRHATFFSSLTMGRELPSGEFIWIGCSIAPEIEILHRMAVHLIAIGAIILFFGLTGGWWISSRAIRPVETISATALKISAGDLSQRINTAETESELGQLAVVLNSTFARLETAFAQQKQFASDAAHELRTPVAVMLTQTQTSLNRERDTKDYKETLEACQRAAQRMRSLIGSLLELARLDAGQEQFKRVRFDLSKVVSDCADLVRPLAVERGLKISTELPPLEMDGDSGRLAQAVTNLLSNAIQYNRDGGQVNISLKVENGMAVLSVADRGHGIPAEDLPRVFERFYRADKSRSSGNAGLGLAISKAIITAHGGTIEVASEENAGTTFTVRLPANIS